jgi:hypothetical protein
MTKFRWRMSEFRCGQDLLTGSVRDAAVGATTVEPDVGPLARMAPLSCASPAAAPGSPPAAAVCGRTPAGDGAAATPLLRHHRTGLAMAGCNARPLLTKESPRRAIGLRLQPKRDRRSRAKFGPGVAGRGRGKDWFHGVDFTPRSVPRDRLKGVAAAPDGSVF